MKKKLESIPLNKIKNNPYRDTKRNPIDPEKIEQLVESITATDFWDGVYARPAKGGTYELAFGHHRIEAARKAGLKEVPITVMDLSDAEMIKRMARENVVGTLEVVCEAVRAAVEALGAGVIEIPAPDPKTNKSQLRYAPSFRTGASVSTVDTHPYTILGIASFLGYTKNNNTQVKHSVAAAFKTLEAIQTGALKDGQIKGTKINEVLSNGAVLDAKTAEAAVRVQKEQQAFNEGGQKKLTELHRQMKEAKEKIKEEEKTLQAKIDADHAAYKKALEEENARRAKKIAEEIAETEAKKKARAEQFETKRAALDAKVEEYKEQARVTTKAYNKHETQAQSAFKTAMLKLNALSCTEEKANKESLRYDMRDTLAYLSRNPFLSAGQRENLRKAILEVAEWFTWQANDFLPRKEQDVLKEAYAKEELKRKTQKEGLENE